MANVKKDYSLNVSQVGQKLKSLRKQHNFVQDDIARFLGVTRSAYASIERGTYGTRVEVLAKIILFYAKHEIELFMEELIGLDEFLKPRRITPGISVKLREMELLIESKTKELEAVTSEKKTLEKANAQMEKMLDKKLS